MNRRDFSFTIALCASLLTHGALAYALVESYVRQAGRQIHLPGHAREAEMTAAMLALVEENPLLRLGDANADGHAIAASPGPRPQEAPRGMQDQPFLSRDPAGPGQVGDPPSESPIPPGDGGASVRLPQGSSLVSEAVVVGIPIPRESPPRPRSREVSPDIEAHLRSDESSDTTTPPADPAAPAAQASQLPAARPGPPTAADPAPQADSEIHPFSTIGTVDFRPGSMRVQLGRKYRITAPRLSLAAKVDLLHIGRTMLILRLRTDTMGDVISAEIERSSGSAVIDQLFRVVAYEWWFDPPTGADGAPQPDDFLLPIRIY